MEKEIAFTETVVLIDANQLDILTGQMTQFLQQQIGRDLPLMPVDQWVTYLALESGMKSKEGQEIQTLWIYEAKQGEMKACEPKLLKTDYNNMAFRNELGEFTLNSFTAEDFVEMGALYIESLQLLLEDKKVTRLLLFAPNDKIEEVTNLVEKSAHKKDVYLFTDSGKHSSKADCECIHEKVVLYPMMKALGVKGKEV